MLRSKSFRRAASFYSIFLLSNQPSYLPSFSLFLFSIFVTIEYQNPKSSIISRYQKEVSFETTLLSPPLLFLPNFSNDNEMVWNKRTRETEREKRRERRREKERARFEAEAARDSRVVLGDPFSVFLALLLGPKETTIYVRSIRNK